MRLTLTALAALALAAPATAATLPNMKPAHDLSGSYLVTTKHGPRPLSVEYSAAANILRINLPGPRASYVLYDFTAEDAKMVMPQMQRYMDDARMAKAFAAKTHMASAAATADVTQSGSETIAGHKCTDYQITNPDKGTTTTLCVSDDGVLLSLIAPNGDKIIAQTISYAPVPATDVQIPPSYTEFQPPPAAGAAGSAPQ